MSDEQDQKDAKSMTPERLKEIEAEMETCFKRLSELGKEAGGMACIRLFDGDTDDKKLGVTMDLQAGTVTVDSRDGIGIIFQCHSLYRIAPLLQTMAGICIIDPKKLATLLTRYGMEAPKCDGSCQDE